MVDAKEEGSRMVLLLKFASLTEEILWLGQTQLLVFAHDVAHFRTSLWCLQIIGHREDIHHIDLSW